MLELYVPVGHAVQAAREVEAVLVLYVPGGQSVQTLAPAIEYEPGAQFEHVAVPVAAAIVPAEQAIHTLAPEPE
jgi:hypothetical protein